MSTGVQELAHAQSCFTDCSYSVLKKKKILENRKRNSSKIAHNPRCSHRSHSSGGQPACLVSSECHRTLRSCTEGKCCIFSPDTCTSFLTWTPSFFNCGAPVPSPHCSPPPMSSRDLEFSYISVSFFMLQAALNTDCFYLSLYFYIRGSLFFR